MICAHLYARVTQAGNSHQTLHDSAMTRKRKCSQTLKREDAYDYLPIERFTLLKLKDM